MLQKRLRALTNVNHFQLFVNFSFTQEFSSNSGETIYSSWKKYTFIFLSCGIYLFIYSTYVSVPHISRYAIYCICGRNIYSCSTCLSFILSSDHIHAFHLENNCHINHRIKYQYISLDILVSRFPVFLFSTFANLMFDPACD